MVNLAFIGIMAVVLLIAALAFLGYTEIVLFVVLGIAIGGLTSRLFGKITGQSGGNIENNWPIEKRAFWGVVIALTAIFSIVGIVSGFLGFLTFYLAFGFILLFINVYGGAFQSGLLRFVGTIETDKDRYLLQTGDKKPNWMEFVIAFGMMASSLYLIGVNIILAIVAGVIMGGLTLREKNLKTVIAIAIIMGILVGMHYRGFIIENNKSFINVPTGLSFGPADWLKANSAGLIGGWFPGVFEGLGNFILFTTCQTLIAGAILISQRMPVIGILPRLLIGNNVRFSLLIGGIIAAVIGALFFSSIHADAYGKEKTEAFDNAWKFSFWENTMILLTGNVLAGIIAHFIHNYTAITALSAGTITSVIAMSSFYLIIVPQFEKKCKKYKLC